MLKSRSTCKLVGYSVACCCAPPWQQVSEEDSEERKVENFQEMQLRMAHPSSLQYMLRPQPANKYSESFRFVEHYLRHVVDLLTSVGVEDTMSRPWQLEDGSGVR